MSKIFVSIDFEGLPYIVSREHLAPRRSLFQEARDIVTKFAAFTAEKLLEIGYKEVIVADSHALMINIDPKLLPRGVRLVRGYPRRFSMVAHSKGSRFAVFLGYHGRAGTSSVFSHTYSGSTFYRVLLNGEEASEYLLNAFLLGEWMVPVGVVAGSAELLDDVRKYTPWAELVKIKKSIGYYSAISESLEELLEQLGRALDKAHTKSERGELRPLGIDKPIEVKIEFMNPAYAEAMELVPGVSRIGGREVISSVDSMEQAYKLVELAAIIGSGIRSMTEIR